MKLSIIVPVYNAEKYLDECIESILNQTLSDFELILVNDGSQDTSLNICKTWAEKDNRIHIIDKKNGGVSSARNAGLDAASGDYIGFVDSDDYIDTNMYKYLVSIAEKNIVDIVICKRTIPNHKNNYGHNYPIDETFYFESVYKEWQQMYFQGNLETFVTNKIFSRKFISNVGVNFVEIPFLEDFIFLQAIYFNNPKMRYLDKELYFYRPVEGSAVRKYCAQRFETIELIFERSKEFNLIRCGGLYKNDINNNMAASMMNCVIQEGLNRNKNSVNILNKIRCSKEFAEIDAIWDNIDIKKDKRILWLLLREKKYEFILLLLQFKLLIIKVRKFFKFMIIKILKGLK